MSDFQAAFRSKLKSSKPSKDQLRALKAAKKAATQTSSAAPEFKVPAPVPRFSGAAKAPTDALKPTPTANEAGLPLDFFAYREGGSVETAIDAEEAPPAPRPPSAQQVQERGSAGASTSSADLAIAAGSSERDRQTAETPAGGRVLRGELPEGFYADSEADKRARGINLKKRTIEEEMADFEASILEDLRTAEENEQADAEKMAQEKAERDAFEHELRKRKVDELRSLVKKGPKPTPLAPPATQSKRQKTLDLLTGVASSDEDDSESGEDDPGALLNWRAKTF